MLAKHGLKVLDNKKAASEKTSHEIPGLMKEQPKDDDKTCGFLQVEGTVTDKPSQLYTSENAENAVYSVSIYRDNSNRVIEKHVNVADNDDFIHVGVCSVMVGDAPFSFTFKFDKSLKLNQCFDQFDSIAADEVKKIMKMAENEKGGAK